MKEKKARVEGAGIATVFWCAAAMAASLKVTSFPDGAQVYINDSSTEIRTGLQQLMAGSRSRRNCEEFDVECREERQDLENQLLRKSMRMYGIGVDMCGDLICAGSAGPSSSACRLCHH